LAEIHPSRTLPIILDVGTNNEERLKDPEYLGWRHERVRGQDYLDFVDRFVRAVKQELPNTCLQWEDFATPNARPLLMRYQNELLTFNDDVQGTAAVVLGAAIGASKVAGKNFKDHQIVFVGAGSAAIGVADYLRIAMVEEGLSEKEARARFWIVDKDGLLDSDRRDLAEEQKVYGVCGFSSSAFDRRCCRLRTGAVQTPRRLPKRGGGVPCLASHDLLHRGDGRTVPAPQSRNLEHAADAWLEHRSKRGCVEDSFACHRRCGVCGIRLGSGCGAGRLGALKEEKYD
jgi:hypothetical protein